MKNHLWYVVWAMIAAGGLFLLLAFFVKTVTRFQWNIQKIAGLAPQRLIENEEQYFKFMRVSYAATALFLLGAAYMVNLQVALIDDKMRETDRLADGIDRYYDKRAKDFQQSVRKTSETKKTASSAPAQETPRVDSK